MRDGREFNFSYLKAIDIVSLIRDEVSNYTDSPFNVRVETEEASFYRIPRVKFWNFVKEQKELQDYVRDYYRNKLSESMESQQYMMMNGKKGAVCFHLQKLSNLFGVEQEDGVLIDFNITNEDIAGFCGISTRNSVNRILNELKREGVLDIRQQKIVILDNERIEEFIGRELF
nr:Crp/Fnr family transcriptional regulator [Streptococcus lactarius]